MLVQKILRQCRAVRAQRQRHIRHLCHFLQNDGELHSLRRVLAPCERPVPAAQDGSHRVGVYSAFSEVFHYLLPGVKFVILLHGLLRQIRQAGDIPVKVVGVRRAEAGDVLQRLREYRGVYRVRVRHAAHVLEALVYGEVIVQIHRRQQGIVVHRVPVKIRDGYVLPFKIGVFNAARLYRHDPGLAVNGGYVAPCVNDKPALDQLHVCLVYLFSQIVNIHAHLYSVLSSVWCGMLLYIIL